MCSCWKRVQREQTRFWSSLETRPHCFHLEDLGVGFLFNFKEKRKNEETIKINFVDLESSSWTNSIRGRWHAIDRCAMEELASNRLDNEYSLAQNYRLTFKANFWPNSWKKNTFISVIIWKGKEKSSKCRQVELSSSIHFDFRARRVKMFMFTKGRKYAKN